MPTAPATVPGYAEYDPSTGLHMTGTVQQIDPQSYRLQVTGKVDHALELTYDDLRCMPKIKTEAPLICPGFFEDKAAWAGAPLAHILALAGVQAGARRLELTSADGYTMWIYLENALAGGSIIAYEWQGEPLPILHGFPVRAVFPSSSGSYWVKYLVRLEVN
jgi:DMSO/TMAO reductase YedYZ molybdopterin-dependent catalytic subunit